MRGRKLVRQQVSTKFLLPIVLAALVLLLLANPLSTSVAGASHQEYPYPSSVNFRHLAQSNVSTVVTVLDAALNRGDSEAALRLFNDSSVVNDPSNIACLPSPPCNEPGILPSQLVYSSQAQIRGWLEQLVKEKIAVREVDGFNVTGDKVTWRMEVAIDEYRRLGVAPLLATAQVVVHEGKIDSLAIELTPDSTTKLSLAYASSEQSSYSVLAAGFSLGVFALGLVFPVTAIYYISRVKRLFATVPMLDKPWILLGAGVGSLLISLLLEALRDILGLSEGVADTLFITILCVCSFFVMSAMVLMKRAMVGESDD